LSGLISRGCCNTDNGDNVLADTHSGGSNEEEFATSEVIDCPDTWNGGDDVDDIGDDTDDERILNTGLNEEGRSIVENELKYQSIQSGKVR